MLDRGEILKIIEDAYAARMRGDQAKVAEIWAPGAQYRLAGEASLLSGLPFAGDARSTAADLIDLFQFHAMKRLSAVVEERKAALRWRVTLSTGGGEPVTTDFLDLFELDEAGKITSLVQYCDTALLLEMTR
jgi:ketosteroid isomerase-like protein